MVIQIKETDDWINVWKDGELVWSGHSCPLQIGLEALGIPFTTKYREMDTDDDYNWLEEKP